MHDEGVFANCSCHDAHETAELSIARELIWIRGAYRYADRDALDEALAELRAQMDGDVAEPLSVRCWVSGVATLRIDITVPMFSDHSFAPAWCDLLARTAIDAEYYVRPRSL